MLSSILYKVFAYDIVWSVGAEKSIPLIFRAKSNFIANIGRALKIKVFGNGDKKSVQRWRQNSTWRLKRKFALKNSVFNRFG